MQLSGPGSTLPQILQPEFKVAGPAGPMKAGQSGEVTVSFNLLKGYAINHKPPISLKLSKISGVTLVKMDFETPTEDPKSKDEYYVDLPSIKVPVTVSKAGKYEIPGKLTYFFCSKTDGFCSRQVLDVKIPVVAQ
jgi:Thiol:disulfide interchange protein DsbD, N-terminal